MTLAQKHDQYPILPFKSQRAFLAWLKKNHNNAEGVWIKIAKANTGIPSVSHMEALDVALCYGWIDGLRRGLDKDYFLQKFTPRQATSIWSVINKEKVARLIKEEKMQEAGIAAINVAKKNGRWQKAYASSKTITIPADFKKALKASPGTEAIFASLNAQERFSILFHLGKIQTAATREKNMIKYIKQLEGSLLKK